MSISDPTFFDVEALNRAVKVVAGRVSIGTSGAPTVAEGLGFSVAKTADGKYTVTLEKTYEGLLHSSVMFNNLSATAQYEVGRTLSHDVTSGKTVVFEFVDLHTDATPALGALGDGTEFTFCLLLRDGDVS